MQFLSGIIICCTYVILSYTTRVSYVYAKYLILNIIYVCQALIQINI